MNPRLAAVKQLKSAAAARPAPLTNPRLLAVQTIKQAAAAAQISPRIQAVVAQRFQAKCASTRANFLAKAIAQVKRASVDAASLAPGGQPMAPPPQPGAGGPPPQGAPPPGAEGLPPGYSMDPSGAILEEATGTLLDPQTGQPIGQAGGAPPGAGAPPAGGPPPAAPPAEEPQDPKKMIREVLTETGVIKAPKIMPEQQFGWIVDALEELGKAVGVKLPERPTGQEASAGDPAAEAEKKKTDQAINQAAAAIPTAGQKIAGSAIAQWIARR